MISTTLDTWLWRAPKTVPAGDDFFVFEHPATRLRYRDTAPGSDHQALVILCDPPNMLEHYDAVLAALGDAYRVVVVELPGFGFSHAKQADALEFGGAVDAVEQLLLSLSLHKAVLCGPCICGFVTVALAKRARLPVHALVLMQTPDLDNMIAWTGRMDPKGQLRKPVLGQLMMRAMARKITAFWYRYSTAKAFDHAALDATAQRMLKRGAAYSLASMLQRWSVGPHDGHLDVPTLAIWGDSDRSHADTDHTCSRAHAAHADITVFEGCGHFPDLEQPERFAQCVRAFLSGVPQPSS